MTASATPSEYRRVPLTAALQQTRIIAVLRGGDSSRTDAVADILVGNGIRCLELAVSIPGAQGPSGAWPPGCPQRLMSAWER